MLFIVPLPGAGVPIAVAGSSMLQLGRCSLHPILVELEERGAAQKGHLRHPNPRGLTLRLSGRIFVLLAGLVLPALADDPAGMSAPATPGSISSAEILNNYLAAVERQQQKHHV